MRNRAAARGRVGVKIKKRGQIYFLSWHMEKWSIRQPDFMPIGRGFTAGSGAMAGSMMGEGVFYGSLLVRPGFATQHSLHGHC